MNMRHVVVWLMLCSLTLWICCKDSRKPTLTTTPQKESIVFPALTDQVLDNLELLGRVWGFLKYHHPAICTGEYDWDAELFNLLPDYLKIRNTSDRDKLLLKWINRYGDIPMPRTIRETSPDARMKPDLAWITRSGMQSGLVKKLQEIYTKRYQGDRYYASTDVLGNTVYSNEKAYEAVSFPDAGYRLLALYRYWNIINYYFPYKYLTDTDWSDVLRAHMDIVTASSELEYEKAIQRLTVEINDAHGWIGKGIDKVDASIGDYYPPFMIRYIEHKWVVTEFYNVQLERESALNVGDVITHIGDRPVEEIKEAISNYYQASNEASLASIAASYLLRSTTQNLQVTVESEGSTQTKSLRLYLPAQLTSDKEQQRCFRLLNDRIGYVTLETIRESDVSEMMETFQHTKGIIIDIRNYPNSFVSFLIGQYFVTSPTEFAKITTVSPNNPGEFVYVDKEGTTIESNGSPYLGKVVVLVDERSQSQSEYTTMAFQAGSNTVVMGSTTAGADGNITSIPLPGGIFTCMSGLGIYYPDGRETQRVGIIPDIVVAPTIEGIRNGRDEVLEKAIEYIEH